MEHMYLHSTSEDCIHVHCALTHYANANLSQCHHQYYMIYDLPVDGWVDLVQDKQLYVW